MSAAGWGQRPSQAEALAVATAPGWGGSSGTGWEETGVRQALGVGSVGRDRSWSPEGRAPSVLRTGPPRVRPHPAYGRDIEERPRAVKNSEGPGWPCAGSGSGPPGCSLASHPGPHTCRHGQLGVDGVHEHPAVGLDLDDLQGGSGRVSAGRSLPAQGSREHPRGPARQRPSLQLRGTQERGGACKQGARVSVLRAHASCQLPWVPVGASPCPRRSH